MNRIASIGVLSLFIGTPAVFAQDTKVQGFIKARSGATMLVQSKDSSTVDVLLTDSTKVGQTQGVLKARRKDMSMAALIPGLEIQVEGTYNEQRQLVAKEVKFDGSDLERAQSVQAGVHQTEAQSQRNREELTKQNADLQKQREQLAIEQQKIAANKAGIEANQSKIDTNRAKIEAAVARFGQLDDYYILDELTIHFGNGAVQIERQYKPQLLEFATKAKTVDAYMIQVVGYASSSGSQAANQKLSEDRAANVTNFLKQEGDIPLTNVLAPGAMGESRQVGNDKTTEGQAQNRRVVVRVLQNKGVAGLKAAR
jgi:outer membrane protein OmpA-like peptidoglycan-associated protein